MHTGDIPIKPSSFNGSTLQSNLLPHGFKQEGQFAILDIKSGEKTYEVKIPINNPPQPNDIKKLNNFQADLCEKMVTVAKEMGLGSLKKAPEGEKQIVKAVSFSFSEEGVKAAKIFSNADLSKEGVQRREVSLPYYTQQTERAQKKESEQTQRKSPEQFQGNSNVERYQKKAAMLTDLYETYRSNLSQSRENRVEEPSQLPSPMFSLERVSPNSPTNNQEAAAKPESTQPKSGGERVRSRAFSSFFRPKETQKNEKNAEKSVRSSKVSTSNPESKATLESLIEKLESKKWPNNKVILDNTKNISLGDCYNALLLYNTYKNLELTVLVSPPREKGTMNQMAAHYQHTRSQAIPINELLYVMRRGGLEHLPEDLKKDVEAVINSIQRLSRPPKDIDIISPKTASASNAKAKEEIESKEPKVVAEQPASMPQVPKENLAMRTPPKAQLSALLYPMADILSAQLRNELGTAMIDDKINLSQFTDALHIYSANKNLETRTAISKEGAFLSDEIESMPVRELFQRVKDSKGQGINNLKLREESLDLVNQILEADLIDNPKPA